MGKKESNMIMIVQIKLDEPESEYPNFKKRIYEELNNEFDILRVSLVKD